MLDLEDAPSPQEDRPEITYREAVSADYEALDALFYDLLEQHAESVPEVYFLHERPAYSREYVNQLILGLDSGILVAEAQQEVVGLAQLSLHNLTQRGPRAARRYVLVESLIIASHARRLGVGRGLMQAVEAWGHQRQAQHIELTVWEFNQGALDFYHQLGYQTMRRRMWLHLEVPEVDYEDDGEDYLDLEFE